MSLSDSDFQSRSFTYGVYVHSIILWEQNKSTSICFPHYTIILTALVFYHSDALCNYRSQSWDRARTFKRIDLLFSLFYAYRHYIHSRVVKLWSHQSVRQRYALRSSAVRAMITTGGATRVLMLRNTLNVRTMTPSRFSRLASVIFTAFADFTRKITDIL